MLDISDSLNRSKTEVAKLEAEEAILGLGHFFRQTDIVVCWASLSYGGKGSQLWH